MYRLLVADDEIIERKVLLKTLQKNLEGQCELFQAENGREALEIYEKEKIQIAILDIEMPGINGIQAAEKIREKDKNCCIIFLTAYDEFSYAKKGRPPSPFTAREGGLFVSQGRRCSFRDVSCETSLRAAANRRGCCAWSVGCSSIRGRGFR